MFSGEVSILAAGAVFTLAVAVYCVVTVAHESKWFKSDGDI